MTLDYLIRYSPDRGRSLPGTRLWAAAARLSQNSEQLSLLWEPTPVELCICFRPGYETKLRAENQYPPHYMIPVNPASQTLQWSRASKSPDIELFKTKQEAQIWFTCRCEELQSNLQTHLGRVALTQAKLDRLITNNQTYDNHKEETT